MQLYGEGEKEWSLYEDNYPKHMSKLCKAKRIEISIDRITTPPQSPDLNTIENVWAILKANVYSRMPKTVARLKRYIKEGWKKLSPDFATRLVESMPSRIKKVDKSGWRLYNVLRSQNDEYSLILNFLQLGLDLSL